MACPYYVSRDHAGRGRGRTSNGQDQKAHGQQAENGGDNASQRGALELHCSFLVPGRPARQKHGVAPATIREDYWFTESQQWCRTTGRYDGRAGLVNERFNTMGRDPGGRELGQRCSCKVPQASTTAATRLLGTRRSHKVAQTGPVILIKSLTR